MSNGLIQHDELEVLLGLTRSLFLAPAVSLFNARVNLLETWCNNNPAIGAAFWRYFHREYIGDDRYV